MFGRQPAGKVLYSDRSEPASNVYSPHRSLAVAGWYWAIPLLVATFGLFGPLAGTLNDLVRDGSIMIAVLLFGFVSNGLLLIGWNFYWQQVGVGVLVFLILALSFGLRGRSH